jgi:hypothetical protein
LSLPQIITNSNIRDTILIIKGDRTVFMNNSLQNCKILIEGTGVLIEGCVMHDSSPLNIRSGLRWIEMSKADIELNYMLRELYETPIKYIDYLMHENGIQSPLHFIRDDTLVSMMTEMLTNPELSE